MGMGLAAAGAVAGVGAKATGLDLATFRYSAFCENLGHYVRAGDARGIITHLQAA